MHDRRLVLAQVRARGLRLTRQRAVILEALCQLDGHASAERVHQQVARNGCNCDLSTVYRTLETLRDARILTQTDLGRGCAEFEVVGDQPHHHLICLGCGAVFDIGHRHLATLAEAVRGDFGFEPVLDHLAIFGWCRDCREASPPQETEQGQTSCSRRQGSGMLAH